MPATGASNDTLIGRQGNDIVLGEDGNDLLIHNNGDGSDFLEGGAGNDTVQINGANGAGDDISIDPNGNRIRVQRNNLGLFTLDIGTTETLDINGQGGNDVMIGEDGRDIIIANDGNDFVSGGEGNDIPISGNGNDVILGGDGNDVLSGGADTDFLDGGAGQDSAINGETVINVPLTATATTTAARAPIPVAFSMEAFLRGDITIHYDAKIHGVDTFANFNPGEDKIIVAGFDRSMFAAADQSFFQRNADSFVRFVQDGEDMVIQYDADGRADEFGFQDQWILEDFGNRRVDDLMDDILFA